jgi:hypothetical protein
MFKRHVIGLVTIVGSLVACAGSVADDATPGDENDLTTVKTCGGFAGIRCPEGQDCVIPKKDVNVADAAGHCRKPTGRGGEHQSCGGIAGVACGPGLDCVKQIPSPLDAPGQCEKPSTPIDDMTCGGFAGIACPDGFECKLTKKKGQPNSDAAGHCVKATTDDDDGQACGGIAGLRCPKGLTCHPTLSDSGHPIFDAPGHCSK